MTTEFAAHNIVRKKASICYWDPVEEIWLVRDKETRRILMRSVNEFFAKSVIESGRNVLANALDVNLVIVADKSLTYDALSDSMVQVDAKAIANRIKFRSDPDFSVKDRFDILATYISMVGRKKMASAIITGQGGLGKTWTVLETLKACGLEDLTDRAVALQEQGFQLDETHPGFVVVKGYSSPKGIYETLYFNRGRHVIFDDCDNALTDKTAVGIMKSALDSYDVRRVTWQTTSERETSVPKSFIFTGGVIFISNKSIEKISGPLKTRSYCADVTMSRYEIIERMEQLLASEHFMPEYDREHILDSLEFIRSCINHPRVDNISLRTLISLTKLRASAVSIDATNWQKAGLSTMIHGNSEEN